MNFEAKNKAELIVRIQQIIQDLDIGFKRLMKGLKSKVRRAAEKALMICRLHNSKCFSSHNKSAIDLEFAIKIQPLSFPQFQVDV